MPYMSTMGSKFDSIEEGTKLLQKSEVSVKKRKRCHSPKNGKRSLSKSPLGRKTHQDSNSKINIQDNISAVKVKIVSPTLRGVTESSRLLRNGIFSFPTETMYTLVSFIEFRRRKDSSSIKKSMPCQWRSCKSYTC